MIEYDIPMEPKQTHMTKTKQIMEEEEASSTLKEFFDSHEISKHKETLQEASRFYRLVI